MEIKEVASLKEALSMKSEMNHDGDYKLNTWEEGRELVLQLSNPVLHFRWKEELQTATTPVVAVVSEKENQELAVTITIDEMKGSSVFSKDKKRRRL